MRHIFPTLFFVLFFSAALAQLTPEKLQSMNTEQRREAIAALSPQQKISLLQQFRTNVMVEDLEVPAEKKDAFTKVLTRYQESQRKIRDRFKNSDSGEKLTEAEAQRRLDQSFELGLQLLNNKKQYAQEFQKVLTPQQVLQLFQAEGEMRDRVIERKNDRQQRRNAEPRENQRDNSEKSNMRQNSSFRDNDFQMNRGNSVRGQSSSPNLRGNSGFRSNNGNGRRN